MRSIPGLRAEELFWRDNMIPPELWNAELRRVLRSEVQECSVSRRESFPDCVRRGSFTKMCIV